MQLPLRFGSRHLFRRYDISERRRRADRETMDIAPDGCGDAGPAAEDLLVSFTGSRVSRRAGDGEFLIGREVPPSHIQIDHPAISLPHIRLVPGARWALIDFDSRNGVYLNGRRVEYETPITDCMTVHLGAPDGVPVAFHYIATEQPAPAAAVNEADPDIMRTGRAVFHRFGQLGLSRRELQQDNGIDAAQLARFLQGHAWPQPAACAALEMALQWPAGALEAIRRGQPAHEITDLITPEVRWALLVDSAALTLADIAAVIAELPPTTDPRFAGRAEPLRRRLAALERSLATAGAAGCEVTDLLETVARVYTHLVPPAPRGLARPRTKAR
jgi:hypothetical protein